jgi:hypothetical protein
MAENCHTLLAESALNAYNSGIVICLVLLAENHALKRQHKIASMNKISINND